MSFFLADFGTSERKREQSKLESGICLMFLQSIHGHSQQASRATTHIHTKRTAKTQQPK
jgi:hypothetical protein